MNNYGHHDDSGIVTQLALDGWPNWLEVGYLALFWPCWLSLLIKAQVGKKPVGTFGRPSYCLNLA